MNIQDLLNRPAAWLSSSGEASIVVSSRVRLARNLKDAAFPGWAGEEECLKTWTRLKAVLVSLDALKPCHACEMSEFNDLDRLILFERHLISREQVGKGTGSALVVTEDEAVSVMVNEEDHLRMQAIRPGLDLQSTWACVNELDSQIEKHVAYAFSPRLGYLTACPTNVGTGMRASVMLHLPGLTLMDEMNPIIKGMSKIGIMVRGLWGEGSESAGNMFQISNQVTLGEKEEETIASLESIVREILEHERNARVRLMEQKEAMVLNYVGRARGILSHAHLLTSKEALDLLSALRLGIELGIFKGVGREVVDELFILSQPAHLQKMEGRELDANERDTVRARLMRERTES